MSRAAFSEVCESLLQIIELKGSLGKPQTCTWCQKLRAVLGTLPSKHCSWPKLLRQGYVLTDFATALLPILSESQTKLELSHTTVS